MHLKTDLLTDQQVADYAVKQGDTLKLNVPDGKGGFNQTECTVSNVEITDAGTHPDTGEHLMRVTLTFD